MVYFAANDEDIDPGDTQYVDILLACTKHLIQAIKLADENVSIVNIHNLQIK